MATQNSVFYQAHLTRLETLQTTLCNNPATYVYHLIELNNIIEQLRKVEEVQHG